jgi:hypothetical protein
VQRSSFATVLNARGVPISLEIGPHLINMGGEAFFRWRWGKWLRNYGEDEE